MEGKEPSPGDGGLPVKLLSQDEWGYILSFLDFFDVTRSEIRDDAPMDESYLSKLCGGCDDDEDDNFFPLLDSNISDVIDWELVLKNVYIFDNVETLIEYLVRRFYREQDGGRFFDSLMSNPSLNSDLMTALFVYGMKLNNFRWNYKMAIEGCWFYSPYWKHLDKATIRVAIDNLYGTLQTSEDRGSLLELFLRNTTCNPYVCNQLLLVAVNVNDVEWVKRLLLRDSRMDVMQALESARQLGNHDIVVLLQDIKVPNWKITCPECDINDGVVGCCSGWGNCSEFRDIGEPLRYCEDCMKFRSCDLCSQCFCKTCCESGEEDLRNDFYYTFRRCSTCSKFACAKKFELHVESDCIWTCANYSICGKSQCRQCLDENGENDWFKCSVNSSHVFCKDCSPENRNVQYAYAYEPQCCPAWKDTSILECVNTFKRRSSGRLVCRQQNKLNTTTNSRGWFKCPRNPHHMFCRKCNPLFCNDKMWRYYRKQKFDIFECPACQLLILQQEERRRQQQEQSNRRPNYAFGGTVIHFAF